MEVLVVTGGIGSGKSEVCKMLQSKYGCGLYNADQHVKLLYDRHRTLLADIENLLGESLRDDDGKFIPTRLSARIFSDKDLLRQVEELVFPALTEDFEEWSKDFAGDRFVVFESATILEKPQLKGFGDKIVLVDADIETRLERACARDSASKENISVRMQNQKLMNSISSGAALPEVDAVIRNDGTLDELQDTVVGVIEKLYGNL